MTEFQRTPDREQDGTASWSVATLGRAVRRAADGLPTVSDDTVWRALGAAGFSWQADRSWRQTGVVQRKRKAGVVSVIDPDAPANKS